MLYLLAVMSEHLHQVKQVRGHIRFASPQCLALTLPFVAKNSTVQGCLLSILPPILAAHTLVHAVLEAIIPWMQPPRIR